jgi:hypothetical protein
MIWHVDLKSQTAYDWFLAYKCDIEHVYVTDFYLS